MVSVTHAKVSTVPDDGDADSVSPSDWNAGHAIIVSAGDVILGKLTAAGTVEELTPAQVRTLLNVENGATGDQTAAEILTALLTVDGPGTGLNADLLDGNEASAFATAAQGALADSALQNINNEALGDLADVSVAGAVSEDILVFQSGVWVPQSLNTSGIVSAAAALTDNAILRGDGGARGAQTSGVTIDDSNNLGLPGNLTITKDNPTLTLADETDGDFEIELLSSGALANMNINAPSGNQATIQFNPNPADGTSSALFRFFRQTNTTGGASLQVLQGNNTTTANHQLRGDAGYQCGSPTGGMKSIGDINAQAVYDDNSLLTCMALAKEFLENGEIDIDRWDSLVPDREWPEAREMVQAEDEIEEEVSDFVKNGDRFDLVKKTRKRRVPRTVNVPVYRDGKPLMAVDKNTKRPVPVMRAEPVMVEHVTPGRVEKRVHHTARIFKAMTENGFDPRDPDAYFAKMQADEALPGMPTKVDWVHNSLSLGEQFSRKWLSMEMLAIVCNAMWLKIKDHEKRIAALEKAA